MFTDMVGYSALSQRDEAKALALLEVHNRLVREKIAISAGKEIKTVGDAFLIEFSSALDATKCAISIQMAIHERNAASASEPGIEPLHIRIGIHLGDVVSRDGDVFGDGVNIAARIQAAAPPDGILVSEDVARQVQNKLEVGLINLGKGKLKNINLPVDIYALQLPWLAPAQDATRDQRRQRRNRRVLLTAVPLLLLMVVVGWWVLDGPTSPIGKPPIVADAGYSIAVLPFADMSQAKDQEYFADGLSEELLNLLAKIPQLKVIARTSSFSFKGKDADIATIAKALNVTTVLEGSVRKSQDKIRVTAQLIRASDSVHLWSETYDRKITDTFAIQDDIANAVVEALKIKLLPSQRASHAHRHVPHPDAYDQYLLGRQLMQTSRPGAEETFTKAIALDPQYAAAYTQLAMVTAWRSMGTMDTRAREEVAKKAFAAADKGIALDPASGDAYATRGYLRYALSWDWSGAEADFSQALRLDPNDAKIPLKYANLQAAMGNLDQALASSKRATELDPLFYPPLFSLAEFQMAVGDYGGARRSTNRVMSLHPDNQSRGQFSLALISLLEGQPEKTKAYCLQSADDHAPRAWLLAMAEFSLGDAAASQRALNEFIAKNPKSNALSAQAHAWRGERDAAFAALDRAYATRNNYLTKMPYDPLMANLRDDPRFAALLKKMGLPEARKKS